MKKTSIKKYLESTSNWSSFFGNPYKDKWVQIIDNSYNELVERGDIFGKLQVYPNESCDDFEKEIDLIAPLSGYYFIDIEYRTQRISNIDINAQAISFFDSYGESIDDGEDHFVDSYNEMMNYVLCYYDQYCDSIVERKKYYHYGEVSYEIGFPKENEKPIDFLSVVDKFLLYKRVHQSEKENIRDCDTIASMAHCAMFQMEARLLLFIKEKKVFFNRTLVDFTDVLKWEEDSLYKVTLKGEDNALYSRKYDSSRINSIKAQLVFNSIIESNKTNNYSQIYQGEDAPELQNEKAYTLRSLIDDEDDLELLDTPKFWNVHFSNQYDLDLEGYKHENDESIEHYCDAADDLLKLENDDDCIYVLTDKEGYYNLKMPSFIVPQFLDIPFIHFTTKEFFYARTDLKKHHSFEYEIKSNKFAKTKTLIWTRKDNYFEILVEGWYEFKVSLEYEENVPTITLIYKNGYSRKIIDSGENIKGDKTIIYLLLEDDSSIIFNKSKYIETYLNDFGYLFLQYKLDVKTISALTHNAITAVRIETFDGKEFEYEAEPLIFDDFKTYAKTYAEGIVQCDPSIRLDFVEETPSCGNECYVYLMHDTTNGFYKIGISNNPEYRERTLQSEKPTIELLAAKQFPIRAIAEAFESALHKAYAQKRIRGEWFDLTGRDVVDLKKALS